MFSLLRSPKRLLRAPMNLRRTGNCFQCRDQKLMVLRKALLHISQTLWLVLKVQRVPRSSSLLHLSIHKLRNTEVQTHQLSTLRQRAKLAPSHSTEVMLYHIVPQRARHMPPYRWTT